MTERCCSRHHYTCSVGDGSPPEPCCVGCPAHPAHMEPMFGLDEVTSDLG